MTSAVDAPFSPNKQQEPPPRFVVLGLPAVAWRQKDPQKERCPDAGVSHVNVFVCVDEILDHFIDG